MEYEDFSGRFVEHCHILDHEDHGMMEIVTIVDPSQSRPTPRECRESGGSPDSRLDEADRFAVREGDRLPALHEPGQGTGEIARSFEGESGRREFAGKKGLADFPRGPFELVADPDLGLFRQFGAVKDASKPLHATIVLIRWKAALKEIGDTPFTDFAAV